MLRGVRIRKIARERGGKKGMKWDLFRGKHEKVIRGSEIRRTEVGTNCLYKNH